MDLVEKNDFAELLSHNIACETSSNLGESWHNNDTAGVGTFLRHDFGTLTAGFRLIFIDTGVNPHREFFLQNSVDAWLLDGSNNPQDSYGHGTASMGVAAAKNDGLGMTGVFPGVPVTSVKVWDDSVDTLTVDSIIAGIDYVLNNYPPPAVVALQFVRYAAPHHQGLHDRVMNLINSGYAVFGGTNNDGWDVRDGGADIDPDLPQRNGRTVCPAHEDWMILASAYNSSQNFVRDNTELTACFGSWTSGFDSVDPIISAPGSATIAPFWFYFFSGEHHYTKFSGVSAANPQVAAAGLIHMSRNVGYYNGLAGTNQVQSNVFYYLYNYYWKSGRRYVQNDPDTQIDNMLWVGF